MHEIVAAVLGTLEVTDGLRLEALVTKLLHMREVGLLSDELSLSLESLNLHVVAGFGVLHPVSGEEVTEAGSNLLSIHSVLRRAVTSPGGFSGVSSSQSVDLGVS